MIEWKKFYKRHPPITYHQFLVSDGKNVSSGRLRKFDFDGSVFWHIDDDVLDQDQESEPIVKWYAEFPKFVKPK